MQTVHQTETDQSIATTIPTISYFHPIMRIKMVIHKSFEILVNWNNRIEMRRAMSELTEEARNDMGLTEANISVEATKPFWRA